MINVIGLGYIGLPTALMFAQAGCNVVGTDINLGLIKQLQKGQLTFDEKNLDALFEKAQLNNVQFTTEYQATDTYIIAAPTPYLPKSKKLDPSFVINAIERVLKVALPEAIIIIESTVAPGTIDKYIRPIVERQKDEGKNLHLVHAPERIIPGNMIEELKSNSRTIGVDNAAIGDRVKKLYQKFCLGEIVTTDIRSAEMSKVVENTFRDVNIAFANELAKICRADNIDVYEVIRIANKHPRVDILKPGPGVGGHCISVDPWFLVGDYPDLTNLILTARKTNDSMPQYVLNRISDIMKQYDIKELSKVGFYGLTYKENVDDIRESPTLQLLQQMEQHLAFGAKVYDPYVKKQVVNQQITDFDVFLEGIELLVIMVAHDHIKPYIDEIIKDKIIFDTKNSINSHIVEKL